MELNLNNSGQIIAIITFTAWLVKYLIVNPLQTAITALKEAVTEMKNMVFRMDKDQKSIDKRLVRVEESNKVAHHRIDGLEAIKN
ncbi:hypothetical protein [Pelosinus sp. IPA-1]|uniref:hypothetical protein n=1 Tax=Pelosinus sp. IPA-1 TaxID=3029569 RepID=UPI002436225B|nr:hypothetical protein [Pelosinus sp. IPA-1]GMB01085.1 hypothetical protein PIPA1_38840 [Pelosinus sp. IPA-1]